MHNITIVILYCDTQLLTYLYISLTTTVISKDHYLIINCPILTS